MSFLLSDENVLGVLSINIPNFSYDQRCFVSVLGPNISDAFHLCKPSHLLGVCSVPGVLPINIRSVPNFTYNQRCFVWYFRPKHFRIVWFQAILSILTQKMGIKLSVKLIREKYTISLLSENDENELELWMLVTFNNHILFYAVCKTIQTSSKCLLSF